MTAESSEPRPDELVAIGALSDPKRRALYEFIAIAGDWVSRDRAAEAVSLERGTAAHHLERLAADGLLDVDFRRLSGRQGPGAGRPAKLYRRAEHEFDVSLPPRDYELAGQLLAEAANRSRTDGTDIVTALEQAARAEGERLAAKIRTRLTAAHVRRSRASRKRMVVEALGEQGFEPVGLSDGTVVLRNCPFHQLAQTYAELICGMNLCLVASALDGAGETGLRAELDPEPGACCVRLRPAT